jgi:hypothetical protein
MARIYTTVLLRPSLSLDRAEKLLAMPAADQPSSRGATVPPDCAVLAPRSVALATRPSIGARTACTPHVARRMAAVLCACARRHIASAAQRAVVAPPTEAGCAHALVAHDDATAWVRGEAVALEPGVGVDRRRCALALQAAAAPKQPVAALPLGERRATCGLGCGGAARGLGCGVELRARMVLQCVCEAYERGQPRSCSAGQRGWVEEQQIVEQLSEDVGRQGRHSAEFATNELCD